MEGHRENNSDHDLLIKLNTRFDSFEKMTTQMWDSLNEKMARFLLQIENKADKRDVDFLKDQLELTKSRISQLEEQNKRGDIKRDTIINLGSMGLKGWAIVSGMILFALAIYKAWSGAS